MGHSARLAMASGYAALVTVFGAAVLLDVVSANLTGGGLAGSELGDVLLLLLAVVMVAGVGAVWAAWPIPTARWLVTLGLALLSIEIVGPLLLTPLVGAFQDVAGLRLGAWIRVAGVGGAAASAWLALWIVIRGRQAGDVRLE